MAAEVRVLRFVPREVCSSCPASEGTEFIGQETDRTFCRNARFKEQPPKIEQRLTVLSQLGDSSVTLSFAMFFAFCCRAGQVIAITDNTKALG